VACQHQIDRTAKISEAILVLMLSTFKAKATQAEKEMNN
jgi:hypothetical protein